MVDNLVEAQKNSRHTCATALAEANIPPAIIMDNYICGIVGTFAFSAG